jgi:ribonuclease inhibitor
MPKKRRVVLNGRKMRTRAQAHAHLSKKLKLPRWYGRNLDALCDCLGEIGTPTVLVLRHAGALKKNLGAYGGKMLCVLSSMTGVNPNLELTVRERF